MAEDPDIKTDVNRGLAWVGLASAMVGVLDIVSRFVILALWISKKEYGIAGLAIPLFPVLDRATDMGLSAAVIQRDDHSEDKISTVFWLNVAISLVMFGLLALVIGPGLAAFQGEPIVASLLTVYGAKLLWQNVYFMPWALMTKELRFKELSIIRMLANVAEFAGKVGFAAAGFGVWCFVLGPLCRVVVTGVGIQLRHPWRPRFVLRVREALDWFTFGIKASGSKVLFYLYTNVDYQVVFHYFGKEANGIYYLAYELVLEPVRIISDVIVAVAFPTFAKLKYQRDKLIAQFNSFTRMNLVVMMGFLGIAFVSGDDMIRLFLSSDPTWVDAADRAFDVVRVLCAVGVLRALSFVVPPLLDGMGRPALTLIYTAVASVVLPLLFVVSAIVLGDRYQELSVAIAWAVGYPIAFAVLFAMALGLLELKLWTYLRQSIGIALIALLTIAVSAGVRWLATDLPVWARFSLPTVTMVGIFFVLLAYFEGISPRSVVRAIKGDSV